MSGIGLGAVEKMDAEDALAPFRGLFHLPEGLIYLDGNSLGPRAQGRVRGDRSGGAREEWARRPDHQLEQGRLVHAHRHAGRPGGAGIIGADADEVVVCDTTSINIYKTLQAALALRPGAQACIVSEGGSFPTDLYMHPRGCRRWLTRCHRGPRLEGVDAVRTSRT